MNTQNEKYFYETGYPPNYAKAYEKDEDIVFEVGILSVGIMCGGQSIERFSKRHARELTFETFVEELDLTKHIASVVGKDGTMKVLTGMWEYLQEASAN